MNHVAPPLPPSAQRTKVIALVLGFLTGVVLWQRLRLGFNGPYLDESDYLYVGRVLRDGTPWNTYTYVFSSHIPLHVLGIGDRLGGLLGARAMALVLGLASLGFFFGATRALFGSARVAWWSVGLLAMASPHLFISKFATYDVVSFCFFTASLWLLLIGLDQRRLGWLWCLLASVVFAAAVLSKYAVVVHAPILAIVVAVRRPKLLAAALLPCVLLLAEYTYRHWPDLKLLYLNQVVHAHADNSSRTRLLLIALRYTGPVLALALIGGGMLIRRRRLHWRALRVHVFLLAMSLPLIAVHLRAADSVSMYKHMVYPVAALAPLAGWLLHRLERRRIVTALAVAALLTGLGAYQTRQMERAFVDLAPMVDYLRPKFSPTTTILSEEGYVFRYAFPEAGRKRLHEFTWFDNDGDGKRTPKDVMNAIWDGKPDYVMTFGQLTPNLTAKLRTAILPHQYRKVFERPYVLSDVMSQITHGSIELWKRNGAYKGKYPLGGK